MLWAGFALVATSVGTAAGAGGAIGIAVTDHSLGAAGAGFASARDDAGTGCNACTAALAPWDCALTDAISNVAMLC
jgi:hypothetical protein